jgi:hypothetical protein
MSGPKIKPLDRGCQMNLGVAGRLADVLTLLDTGRTAEAATTIRTVLKEAGYPLPGTKRLKTGPKP